MFGDYSGTKTVESPRKIDENGKWENGKILINQGFQGFMTKTKTLGETLEMRLSVHPGTRVRIPPSPRESLVFTGLFPFYDIVKAVQKMGGFFAFGDYLGTGILILCLFRQNVRQDIRGFTIQFLQCMAVDIQCGAGVRMSESSGDGPDIDTGADQKRCGGMA